MNSGNHSRPIVSVIERDTELETCVIVFHKCVFTTTVKPQPFLKNALVSQDRFFEVPTYKRAMTFVFLARYVLGFKSQNQWKKFTEQDLKFNQRSFNRWCDKDYDLMNNCSEFKKLPDVNVVAARTYNCEPSLRIRTRLHAR